MDLQRRGKRSMVDTDDEKVSVLYKRKEGGYGLIQAENKVVL